MGLGLEKSELLDACWSEPNARDGPIRMIMVQARLVALGRNVSVYLFMQSELVSCFA